LTALIVTKTRAMILANLKRSVTLAVYPVIRVKSF